MFYGINTELFQSGSEFKSKSPIAIPWKVSAKINIPEKRFELDLVPCKKELELVSVRYGFCFVLYIPFAPFPGECLF